MPQNPWVRHRTHTLHRGAHLDLHASAVTTPAGHPGTYEWVDVADQVRVAATDGRGRVLLVGQWHYLAHWLWQLPGGSIDPGEAPADAGARELCEETGLSGGHWTPLGPVQLAPALTPARVHLYRATGTTPGESAPEPDESEAGLTTWWARPTAALQKTNCAASRAALAALLPTTEETTMTDTPRQLAWRAYVQLATRTPTADELDPLVDALRGVAHDAADAQGPEATELRGLLAQLLAALGQHQADPADAALLAQTLRPATARLGAMAGADLTPPGPRTERDRRTELLDRAMMAAAQASAPHPAPLGPVQDLRLAAHLDQVQQAAQTVMRATQAAAWVGEDPQPGEQDLSSMATHIGLAQEAAAAMQQDLTRAQDRVAEMRRSADRRDDP